MTTPLAQEEYLAHSLRLFRRGKLHKAFDLSITDTDTDTERERERKTGRQRQTQNTHSITTA